MEGPIRVREGVSQKSNAPWRVSTCRPLVAAPVDLSYFQTVRVALPFRERWRTFADAVAVALGINVWVSLLLVPGLFIGAFGNALFVALLFVPLGTLVLGLWRRSESLLLLGFPIALLGPVLAEPTLFDEGVFGPVRFTLVAISLVAYMFGASVFTFFHEPDPPERVRPLSSASKPIPVRWKRRFRVYAGLATMAVVFPAVLLTTLLFDESNRNFVRSVYPGRAEVMTALFALLVLGAWGLLYYFFFFGALKRHRTGDRDLLTDLALLRRRARRGKPGLVFYLGVTLALGLMFLLLALR